MTEKQTIINMQQFIGKIAKLEPGCAPSSGFMEKFILEARDILKQKEQTYPMSELPISEWGSLYFSNGKNMNAKLVLSEVLRSYINFNPWDRDLKRSEFKLRLNFYAVFKGYAIDYSENGRVECVWLCSNNSNTET